MTISITFVLSFRKIEKILSPILILGKQQAKLEAVKRLRKLGLSDAQIAEALDLSLEKVQQDDRSCN